jgi:RimJ/RimL family protein N-acetyltransferase
LEIKETGEVEIGYAVAKISGKRLRHRSAINFLVYAFERLQPEKVVAVARPENAASRRVMENSE